MFGWFKRFTEDVTASLSEEDALAHELDLWDFSRRSLFVDPAGIETMRDRFAMAALTGILASPEHVSDVEIITGSAYQWADSMMKARGQ